MKKHKKMQKNTKNTVCSYDTGDFFVPLSYTPIMSHLPPIPTYKTVKGVLQTFFWKKYGTNFLFLIKMLKISQKRHFSFPLRKRKIAKDNHIIFWHKNSLLSFIFHMETKI